MHKYNEKVCHQSKRLVGKSHQRLIQYRIKIIIPPTKSNEDV